MEIPQFVNENFDIYKGSEKKYLIFKNNAPKVITITAISDFEKFKDRHIKHYLSNVSDAPGIIIGKGLARILNVKVGDKVSIASPLDVDLITGIAPIDTAINISGIFNYNIMD